VPLPLSLSKSTQRDHGPVDARRFYEGIFFGSLSFLFLAFCSCLLTCCFRPLSLAFLPLSPIA
jgi:hypothetical protein